MSNVIIDDTNLTNIANAIRGVNGGTETYKPGEMAAAIAALSSGADFSKLKHTSVSGSSATTQYQYLPDLSSIVDDFSKIALMFWCKSTGNGAYLYIKGVNDRRVFAAVYETTYSRYSYSTPYDTDTEGYEIKGDLDTLQLYHNGIALSNSFKGTLYIYHE